MATVATGWVELKPSAKDFGTQTTAAVEPQIQKTGSGIGDKLGTAIWSAMGVMAAKAALSQGLKLGAFIKGAVDQASDLNETVSKTGVIFGDAAGQVEKFARQGAAKLGQTKQEVLDAAGTFGIFGKAAGLQGPKLAKFSTGLSSLATDLSSFYNTDTKTASDALGAALRGEGEPIRQFGVLLDDATLKAEAMRLGILKPVKDKAKILSYQTNVTLAQKALNDAIAENGKGSLEALKAQANLGTAQSSLQKAVAGTVPPLTQQQKVLAAQSSIMRQTKDAQGDFARTSGGLANQQRILGASIENIKTKIGTLFLPVVLKATKLINSYVMPIISKFVKGLTNQGVGTGFANSMGPVEDVLKNIGRAVGNLDWGPIKDAVKNINLRPFADSLTRIDFTKLKESLGSGVNDTISVFGVVIGFAAEHVDTLAKYLPLLVGAFIAYKAAQAANNVLELARLPIMAASAVATIVSANANRALATQLMVLNGVERTSMLTRLRATVATVASTVASKVAAGAARAWAATQWLLNAALSANPIGLVVIAIVALVAALIIAWKKSDTFRAIVTKAFEAIKKVAGKVFGWLSRAIVTVVNWIKNHWKLLIAIFLGPLGIVVGLVVTHFGKIKSFITTAIGVIIGWIKKLGHFIVGAVDFFKRFTAGVKEKITAAIDFVKEIPGKAKDALSGIASSLFTSGSDLIQGLIDGIMDKFEDVKGAVSKVADAVGKFWPGSPIKEGPLKSWNNGGAGKRLVGFLADGLSDTRPVERAAANLARAVRTPSLAVEDTTGSTGLGGSTPRGGVSIHVEKLQPHDYRAFMGDLQRRSQRASLGGFA